MQTNSARNKALLFGTGWTLAMAAAPAFLKSSGFEPIYLMTLGAMALGWAGALLYALATSERAANEAIAAAAREDRTVVGDLAKVVGIEMQRARIELVRVDDLLAHAIAQLMSAFNSVSNEARRHQEELVNAATAAQGTEAAESLRAAAERVASDVNGAVTALQFRDVVGQKLGHVRQELDALERVMQQIRDVSDSQTQPQAALGRAPPESGALGARVQGLLRNLEQGKATSPVQQELMHAGDVELF